MNNAELLQYHEKLVSLPRTDQTELMLEIAAIVQSALEDLGVAPVVVGGLAVAAWVRGSYLTHDIDVVMPHIPEINERLAALGFTQHGRHWVLAQHGVSYEAPGSYLTEQEEYANIELASGATVRVLRPEDLLIYRLHEFIGGGHADSFQQILWLLGAPTLNRDRLEHRLEQERLTASFDEVQRCAKKVESSKIETWELHDLAKSLRTRATVTQNDPKAD